MSIDPGKLSALLVAATPAPAKVTAYAADTYVHETIDRLTRAGADPAEFARTHSLLLLKPDAIVGRSVEPTLQWLTGNGFRVVAARRLPVDRHLVRALWYFAWNIASPQRRRLADLLIGVADALVLVVTTDPGSAQGAVAAGRPDAGAAALDALPVSVRLTAAKGPTDPRKRVPGELRHLLGRYSYLLNLVHSPDDPADVLRELAIYFDEATTASVLAESRTGEDRTADATALAADLYTATPARSFDRAAALDRICTDLGCPAPDTDTGCAELLESAWARGVAIDPWSALVLGSYVLPMRIGTGPQLLPPVTAAEWAAWSGSDDEPAVSAAPARATGIGSGSEAAAGNDTVDRADKHAGAGREEGSR